MITVSARRRTSTESSATRRCPRRDQVERALALADAALADQQHAQAEHVHQHAVDDLARGQVVLEDRGQLADRHRRRDAGAQQRHAGLVGGGRHLGRQRHACWWRARTGCRWRTTAPRASSRACRRQALQVAHLAVAVDEHAAGPQVLVIPGQGQAGLLDVGTGDLAVETGGAGDELQRKSGRVLTAPEQASHRDDGRGGHVGRRRASRGPSAGSTSGCAALRGTWRWCGAPAPGPRAAGC